MSGLGLLAIVGASYALAGLWNCLFLRNIGWRTPRAPHVRSQHRRCT